ncbi:hypothetical protein BG000_007223 [Podila horticola]|nr:hypothetical protein BG000_007223 [Podila horticola]
MAYKTAIPKPRLTPEEKAHLKRPKVLIVGAGIGGLTLGILLQKGGIDYQIFERAKEVKPLGSAIALGANVHGIFTQLGIYDEFVELGKPCPLVQTFNSELELLYISDFTARTVAGGSQEFVIARPDLYNLLLHNSTYEGDILVGADGAHSAIRQHLYSVLKKEKSLPATDDKPLPYKCVCLVGQTEVLDPEEFPDLKLPLGQFLSVIGDNNCLWVTFTTSKNTVCFMVVQYLDERSFKSSDSFRNSEWGPEAAEAMSKQVRNFKVPGGKDGRVLTLGDYIDRTPKELMSKVMLEEKLNPSGAAGALSAIYDAVALANWICSLESSSLNNVEAIFKEYYAERYPAAKEAFRSSQTFSKLGGKTLASIVLKAAMKRIPKWLWTRLIAQLSRPRPQASFLPLVEDIGTVPAGYQPSLHKTLAILEQRKKTATFASSEVVAV